MSRENVEVMRRAFEAYNRGDVDAAVAYLAPECEYHATGALPGFRGISRGREGYKRFVSWLRAEFDDARIDVRELVDAGDHVLASLTLRGRGKRSGAETSWDIWQVWTLQDGKAVRGEGFTNREDALKAAGLEE
jgi:ketosteroid isomerase-like protein